MGSGGWTVVSTWKGAASVVEEAEAEEGEEAAAAGGAGATAGGASRVAAAKAAAFVAVVSLYSVGASVGMMPLTANICDNQR
jgi:hypothetical protein